jgi:hypothetical protein
VIIDYRTKDSLLPKERDVWLQACKAEKDGHEVTLSILNAMSTCELKYVDGKFYRLCRHCMDYLEVEEFYQNKRYVLGVGYICKRCTATRRRIKSYAVPSFISDVGMKDVPHGISFRLNEETKKVIHGRLNVGYNEEEDS